MQVERKHCPQTGTASPHSLLCMLCYLTCELTKLILSLLLSWEPALASSLYERGAGSPTGEEACCSAAHTPRDREDAVPTPHRLWAHCQPLHRHLHLQIPWCEWNVFPCHNANTVVCISGRSCKRALGHRGRRIKTFHPIRSCEVPRADHW